MENSIARRAALVAFLLAAPALAQTRRLLPVDESPRDPSLVSYLANLKAAVARQDRDALLALVHPDIKTSFGGDDGVANFHPEWPVLERLLRMGGAWQGATFSVPYVFAKFPADLDAFEYAAVTGQGVWLREGPSVSARRLRPLTYEIVQVREQGEDWWNVTTLRGENGYISARYVASPIGYRAIFQKDERGEWKMFALIAGD